MRNPKWTRDENILALDIYLRFRNRGGVKEKMPEFTEVVRNINRLGELHDLPRNETFRNASGVFLTIENFTHLDPLNAKQGTTGISNMRRDLWAEYADKPEEVATMAKSIMAHLEEAEKTGQPLMSDIAEKDIDMLAPSIEGRVLQVSHLRRERNPRLVEKLKDLRFDRQGFLDCEVCAFDYERSYGKRGHKFMEAHHRKPLSSLKPEGEEVRAEDYALICANCHRMIHRFSPWWTVEELRDGWVIKGG